MERAGARSAGHGTLDADLWPDAHPDRELIAPLNEPADYATVFEYGLDALLRRITEI